MYGINIKYVIEDISLSEKQLNELNKEINKLSKDLNHLKQKRASLEDNNQYLTLIHSFCQEDIQKHNEQIKELESQKKLNDEKI